MLDRKLLQQEETIAEHGQPFLGKKATLMTLMAHHVEMRGKLKHKQFLCEIGPVWEL